MRPGRRGRGSRRNTPTGTDAHRATVGYDHRQMPTFTIEPLGPFSLQELATFGFGQRSEQKWDGVMRLALCLDDYSGHVGVEVRQDDDGVHCRYEGSTSPEPVKSQVARVLSLDHDATTYTAVGDRDPVIA